MTRTPSPLATPSLRMQKLLLRSIRERALALELVLAKTWEGYNLVTPDGLTAGGGDGVRQKGTHTDPTGTAASNFVDGADELMGDFHLALIGAAGTLKDALDTQAKIAALGSVKDPKSEPLGAGWCRAHCGHRAVGVGDTTVTIDGFEHKEGAPADRLRGGLCNACDSWARRNGRPDLAVIQQMRRGNEGPCGCDECKAQVGTYRGDAA